MDPNCRAEIDSELAFLYVKSARLDFWLQTLMKLRIRSQMSFKWSFNPNQEINSNQSSRITWWFSFMCWCASCHTSSNATGVNYRKQPSLRWRRFQSASCAPRVFLFFEFVSNARREKIDRMQSSSITLSVECSSRQILSTQARVWSNFPRYSAWLPLVIMRVIRF